jgi:tetratricopeptide (TPR) repeat protein
MAEDKTFKEAQNAIESGDLARARDLLTGLLKQNQADFKLWLYMSATVDSTSEKIYCLENVLKLDPGNPEALRGLAILRGVPFGQEPPVKPIVRNKWTLEPLREEPKGFARIWTNPLLRFGFIVGLLAAVGVIIYSVIFGLRQAQKVVFITVTLAPTSTPTITPTATATPKFRTATPTFSASTPLSALLAATYTPTPIYINTPHPISEAYRIALRAYDRGEYSLMLNYMQQASRQVPEAADLHYYVGEAYRLLEEYEDAVEAYDKAIDVNPRFAPAYLGRAFAQVGINPQADVQPDLDQAIEEDANYADAYLQRARYLLSQKELAAAQEDLTMLSELRPGDPYVPLLEADILLAQNKPEDALKKAIQANQMDITLLPVYRTLAEIFMRLERYTEALGPAETYMRYREDQNDSLGWALLGEARFRNENIDGALDALDRALELGRGNARIYYIRGEIFLSQGEAQDAINAFADGYRMEDRNFDINLGLGRALYAAERYIDAFQQMNATENMAESDTQLAAVYYWRARILDDGGNPNVAKENYESLLNLPSEIVPEEWAKFSKERLLVLNPPTHTPTVTITPTPTKTQTFTPTPSPTRTPTRRPTLAPTRISRTPTPTRTRSPATATRTP